MNPARIYDIPRQAAFRVNDAARYLGISPNTLRKRSDLGLIPVRKEINGERIFLLRDLDAYLESLPEYSRRGKPVACVDQLKPDANRREFQN